MFFTVRPWLRLSPGVVEAVFLKYQNLKWNILLLYSNGLPMSSYVCVSLTNPQLPELPTARRFFRYSKHTDIYNIYIIVCELDIKYQYKISKPSNDLQ